MNTGTMKHHCAAMKIRTSYKTQQPVTTASRSFGQAELNHWPGPGSVVQACRRVLCWLPLLLLCIAAHAADGQSETDSVPYNFLDFPVKEKEATDYRWTTDHMHVGVRWQPFVGRPENNLYDATRSVIATDSSYAQFWVSWSAIEPTRANTDYAQHPSASLQAIEQAVDACRDKGIKVEFVFFTY